MSELKNVLIIANTQKSRALPLAKEMKHFLAGRQIHVDIFEVSDHSPFEPGSDYDLVITLGGDGTLLSAARKVAPTPLFPINLGNVGFVTEFRKDAWQLDLESILRGEVRIAERLMLAFSLQKEGGEAYRGDALNDVVVSGSGISKLVNLVVHIDDVERIEYRADGIIFSTATGSTAYSAAAGGPILHPELAAIILNPICPFTLTHRPLVLPASAILRAEVQPQQRTELMMTVDGQESYILHPGDELKITRSDTPAKMLYSRNRNFYEVLRTKLNWAGGSE